MRLLAALFLVALAACEQGPKAPKEGTPEYRLEAAKKLMQDKKYDQAVPEFRAVIDALKTGPVADDARRQLTAANMALREQKEMATRLPTQGANIEDLLNAPRLFAGKRVRVSGLLQTNKKYWSQAGGFHLVSNGQAIDAQAVGSDVRQVISSKKEHERITVAGTVVATETGISSPFYIKVDDAQ